MTLQQIDMNILLWIQEHLRIDALTPFWKVITFLGNGGWFWLVAAAVLLIPKKTRRVGITALLSITIGFLITNVLLKNIVARPRPFDAYTEIIPLITRPTDFSFPSGHTCASFASAFAIYRCKEVFPKKWRIAAMVLATLIALSRLYVGVHYPTDVLGGLIVGLFSGWAGWKIEELLMKKRAEKGKSAEK